MLNQMGLQRKEVVDIKRKLRDLLAGRADVNAAEKNLDAGAIHGLLAQARLEVTDEKEGIESLQKEAVLKQAALVRKDLQIADLFNSPVKARKMKKEKEK